MTTASAGEGYDPCEVVERHNRWEFFESAEQAPEQQAAAPNQLGDEYEALTHEPSEDWGKDLAYLCRRMARNLVEVDSSALARAKRDAAAKPEPAAAQGRSA